MAKVRTPAPQRLVEPHEQARQRHPAPLRPGLFTDFLPKALLGLPRRLHPQVAAVPAKQVLLVPEREAEEVQARLGLVHLHHAGLLAVDRQAAQTAPRTSAGKRSPTGERSLRPAACPAGCGARSCGPDRRFPRSSPPATGESGARPAGLPPASPPPSATDRGESCRRLRDVDAFDRLRPIGLGAQFFLQGLQEAVDTFGRVEDVPTGHPVDARGAVVLEHQRPRRSQHVEPVDSVVQGVKPESRLLLGPASVMPSRRRLPGSRPRPRLPGQVSQVPVGSVHARRPLSPRRARPLLLLVASRSASGFTTFGRLAALTSVTRPKRVHACALRLTWPSCRASPGGSPHRAPV